MYGVLVSGRMLLHINVGDYADLVFPLQHHAEQVINDLNR